MCNAPQLSIANDGDRFSYLPLQSYGDTSCVCWENIYQIWAWNEWFWIGSFGWVTQCGPGPYCWNQVWVWRSYGYGAVSRAVVWVGSLEYVLHKWRQQFTYRLIPYKLGNSLNSDADE